LVDGLRRLEYRRYDSAGLDLHIGRGVDIVRAVVKINNLDVTPVQLRVRLAMSNPPS
jgi:glucosamine 6-phosphate synthetase-like amidotransferase/phosphosugar isomerase protein